MEHKVLLAGVVGSTAYGMATPESDIDRLGLYAEPTSRFHGIHLPVDKKATKTSTKPDMAMHEAREVRPVSPCWQPHDFRAYVSGFVRNLAPSRAGPDRHSWHVSLALPSQECLPWLRRPAVQRLWNRSKFPDVPVSRIAKHARHMARLSEQGVQLYRTGNLSIRVQDPEAIRQFGERVADGDVPAAQAMLERAEDGFNGPSPLPDEADETAAEAWLHRVRREMWEEEQ